MVSFNILAALLPEKEGVTNKSMKYYVNFEAICKTKLVFVLIKNLF